MKLQKLDLLLGCALILPFVAMSITTSRVVIDRRDIAWLVVSVVAAGLYGFLLLKHDDIVFFPSLVKLELIVLFAEGIAFGAYCLKSSAMQHRDAIAWLYFYPYLLLTAVAVGMTYALLFGIFQYWRR